MNIDRSILWLAALFLFAAGGCFAPTTPSDSGPKGSAVPQKAPPAASASPLTGGSASGEAPATGNAKGSAHTVELVIDYGDGAQKRFTGIECRDSMTVLDILEAAQKHSHGISFSAHGSGETAMVTKIDDVANQGPATDSKNWIFRVNGRLGDESCGLAKVRPGDAVLWKFEHYE